MEYLASNPQLVVALYLFSAGAAIITALWIQDRKMEKVRRRDKIIRRLYK